MKRITALVLGALFSTALVLSTTSYAAENGNIFNKIQSKGSIEFYDEKTSSKTVFDSSDLYLLARSVDDIDLELNKITDSYKVNLENLIKKIDKLDGKEDNKIGNHVIEKSYEEVLDGIDSYTDYEIEANVVKKSDDNYSYIKIPNNGFYIDNSFLKIENEKLYKANSNLSLEPIIEEINKKGGNLSVEASNKDIATAISKFQLMTPTTVNNIVNKMYTRGGSNSFSFTASQEVYLVIPSVKYGWGWDTSGGYGACYKDQLVYYDWSYGKNGEQVSGTRGYPIGYMNNIMLNHADGPTTPQHTIHLNPGETYSYRLNFRFSGGSINYPAFTYWVVPIS